MRVGDRIVKGWRRFATPRAPVATAAPGWRSPAWLQAAGTRGRALVPSRRWRAGLLGPVGGGGPSPAWLQAAGTRGRALVPSRRWRAVLLGPVVGGLWLVAYQQVLAW